MFVSLTQAYQYAIAILRDRGRGGEDSYMCSSFGSDFVLLLVIFTVLPKGAVFATCVDEFAKLSIL